LVKKIGLIGLSEGNGHPFSFGSIINGYDHNALQRSGWKVIYDYVTKRDISEFGFYNIKITHVWTQDSSVTKKLMEACKIPNSVDDYTKMVNEVDGVIIARDDYETHYEMAKSFLEAGLKVFIDKPLTTKIDELYEFIPYLHTGQLMSASGMRYARELDDVRNRLDDYGDLRLINGFVVNDWNKYGIHLIDAIFGVIPYKPSSIEYIDSINDTFIIHLENDIPIYINALGNVPKMFTLDLIGTKKRTHHEIEDNFSMFRRLLWRFSESFLSSTPTMEPGQTINSIKILIAGEVARKEKRKVFIDEL